MTADIPLPPVPSQRDLTYLLRDLVDPDPCWFGQDGYCQPHGWMETDPQCPHARAKAALTNLEQWL